MKPRTHREPVCQTTLKGLEGGQKTVLLGVDDRVFTRYNLGDLIIMHSRTGHAVTKVIANMRRYRTLEAAIAGEDPKALGHESREAALYFFAGIYDNLTSDQVIVAFDLTPTESRRRRRAAKKSQD